MKHRRPYSKRPQHRSGRAYRPRSRRAGLKPGADPGLKKIFTRIGTPPEKPFVADPFQLKNIAEEEPALVSRLMAEELVPWLKQTRDPWLYRL